MTHRTTSIASMADKTGHPLVAEQLGNGATALLLIHCWGGNRGFWAEQRDALSSDYQLVMPDIAAHGESHREPRDWSMCAMADDVVAWVDTLSLEKPILIGHSMGGGVALEAAAMLGERAGGIIMIDTFGFDFGHIPADVIQGFLDSMRQDFPATVAQIVTATATDRTPQALRKRLIDEMSKVDTTAAIASWDSLLNWNPLPAFERCVAPIGIIHNGAMHPDAAARYGKFFDTQLSMPGHGHFLHMEDPATFQQQLKQLLAGWK